MTKVIETREHEELIELGDVSVETKGAVQGDPDEIQFQLQTNFGLRAD